MNYHKIEDDPRYQAAEEILERGYSTAKVGFFGLAATVFILLFAPTKWPAIPAFLLAIICFLIANSCRDEAAKIIDTIPKRGDDNGDGSSTPEAK